MVLKHGPKFSDLPIKRSGLKCHLIPLNMWTLKYNTEELISRNRHRTGLWLPRGMEVGEGGLGIWSSQMQTITYRTDKHQGPIVQHSYIQCHKTWNMMEKNMYN